MSEETRDEKDSQIASLLESVDILREEVKQLRNSNRILRRVHSALRSANESLRLQVQNATFNDDTFRRFCFGEFDAEGLNAGKGGLPEPESQVKTSA